MKNEHGISWPDENKITNKRTETGEERRKKEKNKERRRESNKKRIKRGRRKENRIESPDKKWWQENTFKKYKD